MKRFAITPLAALGILAGTVPAARAADTTCTTPISSGTINGNLVVPAGASCEQVGKGASLIVEPNPGLTVTIGGNVQAAQCNLVGLTPVGGAISVGGNVQIRNCTGLSGSGYDIGGFGVVTISGNFTCDNSVFCFAVGGSVRGNVQVNNNSRGGGGSGAVVGANNVGGNVQVNNNSGGSATGVVGNTIGGNLQCAGNTPGVFDGGLPNTVTGNKQGQCAGL